MSSASNPTPSQVETVESFNARLVEAGEDIGMRVYLKKLNAIVLKQDIEGFADDLLDLVRRRDCCIPHTLLVKYGVLAEKNSSNNCKALMEQHEFVENEEYSWTSRKIQGPGRPARDCYLQPFAFELCLMRAKNTRKYAKFYSLLCEATSAFDIYRLALKERYIITMTSRNIEVVKEKDDKIDQLTALLASFRAENRQANEGLNTKIDTVVKQNDGLKSDLIEVKRDIGKVADIARKGNNQVHQIADRLVTGARNKAPPPEDDRKAESFTLIKLNNTAGEYAVARVQDKYLPGRLNALRKDNPGLEVTFQSSPAPNSKSGWIRVREEMEDDALVFALTDTARARFTLGANTTEDDLVACIRRVFNEPVAQAVLVSRAEKTVADGRMATITRTVTKTVTQTRIFAPVVYSLVDSDIDAVLDELDDEPGEEGQ